MNENVKAFLDRCAATNINECARGLDLMPDPAGLSKEERIHLAEGITSLFYRDKSGNDGVAGLVLKAEKTVARLGEDVVDWMLDQLKDTDTESAEHFARSLSHIGTPAISHLSRALGDSSVSSYGKINLLLAAAYLNTAEVVEIMPSVIDHAKSQDHMVKSQALNTIGRLANRLSANQIDDGRKTSLFEVAFGGLSDSHALVRQQAVRSIGKLKLNHYLNQDQSDKTEKAYRAILGMDDFQWDHAYIVRHEAQVWMGYFKLDAKMTNNSGSNSQRFSQEFKVLERRELAPETVFFKIQAPLIAKKIEAGQFVIIRPNGHSERIPLSICGWNREEGYIELVIMGTGQTSREATAKQVGEAFQDVVGPLGQRSHVDKYDGTCVVIGGGFGAGAVIPTARDLKAKGNRVVGIIGARNKDLVLMEKEMSQVCDETIVTTNDGSRGVQGFVTDGLNQLMNKEKVSFVLAIGPVPMMKAVSDGTRDKGIDCYVSLNAIMVDGTGMCGACRVTVGEKTRFACFHGPDFNGHEVNFEELTKRLNMFKDLEAIAMQKVNG